MSCSTRPHSVSLSARDRREYLHTPLLGGVELLAAEYRRHVFPRHVHEHAVIGLVEAGHIRFTSGGVHADVSEGDLLFIAPGTVHEACGDGHGAWSYRAFYLTVAQWREVSAELGAAAPNGARVVHDPALHTRAWRAHRALVSGSCGERAFTDTVRALLAASIDTQSRPAGDVAVSGVDAGLAHVRSALDAAPTRRMSISEMAKLAGLGRFHFLHEFSRAYGVSPYAYSLNRRLIEAQRRLAAGAPISTTAQDVGFADQAHLTRHFLRMIGVTPGEYQRAYGAPIRVMRASGRARTATSAWSTR
ncbi:MAG: AraC family transcriptional regulator [Gemmatimonadaceae bacterium]